MAKKRLVTISFGLGGFGAEIHSEDKYSSGRLSGYDEPENFFERWRHEDEFDLEGCIVVDIRHVVKVNPSLAITMPMVDIKLKDGEEEACPPIPDYMLSALGGGFKTMAKIHKTAEKVGAKFSGLDTVCVKTWVELWRENGARIGTIKDNAFVWEE